MSWLPDREPERDVCADPAVDAMLTGRERDLGGFTVRRVLPSAMRRLVGPFIFFDQLGPAVLAPGHGIDVRPHPHINLATVTYLFDGELLHRDSLGSEQEIVPGEVNWMTAGRGIVHSERSSAEARKGTVREHGIQSWVALPTEHEETEPTFQHVSAKDIPAFGVGDARVRVIAGGAYGHASPVAVFSPLFYAEAKIPAGATLTMPSEYAERGAYVVEGEVGADRERAEAGTMLLFREGANAVIRATKDARVMLLGGAPLDGERHIWWNFVSSSSARIEQAKREWKERRFPLVPGDTHEYIPLPAE